MKNGHALASYCGLAVLDDLLHVGTDVERKSIAEEMMNHNIVDLCFKVRAPAMSFGRNLKDGT